MYSSYKQALPQSILSTTLLHKESANFVNIPILDVDNINVASLKAELARGIGVNAKGKKADYKVILIDALERLVKALPEGMVKAYRNILGCIGNLAYRSQLKPISTHSMEQGHQQYLCMNQSNLQQTLTWLRHSRAVSNCDDTFPRNAMHRNGEETGKAIRKSICLKYGGPLLWAWAQYWKCLYLTIFIKVLGTFSFDVITTTVSNTITVLSFLHLYLSRKIEVDSILLYFQVVSWHHGCHNSIGIGAKGIPIK
jgi:hypothetical protein